MQKVIRTLFILMFLASVILWAGCGSRAPAPISAPSSAPKWYLELPGDPNRFYAAAAARSQDMQFAVDKAINNGRTELAQQLQTKISGLFKQFREETGTPEDAEFIEQATSVSKAVVSEAISGSKAAKQEIKQEGKIYQVYVLMEMAIGEANAALAAKIRANNNLYTRFRAAQGFKELESEVEKYEAWKKEQGM